MTSILPHSSAGPHAQRPTTGIPLLALVGATASGKTALALALADRLGSLAEIEIVNADSRQIYRYMNVATAKPSSKERAAVPHHLLDIAAPDERITLAQYQAAANATIRAIWERGKLPVLVGGTGLYIRSVIDALAIPEVPPDPHLRNELEETARRYGAAALHAQLAAVDPRAAARIDSTNVRRVIRALEVCTVTGKSFSEQQRTRESPFRVLEIGLAVERGQLYGRADARVGAMLEQGLVEETRDLISRGYGWELPAMSSLGYREMGTFLRGEATLDEASERLKLNTHRYIRRQLTWFRPDHRINWVDATAAHDVLVQQVAARVLAWY